MSSQTATPSARVPLLFPALVVCMWLVPALLVAASVSGLIPERATGPLSLASIAAFAGGALLCSRAFFDDNNT